MAASYMAAGVDYRSFSFLILSGDWSRGLDSKTWTALVFFFNMVRIPGGGKDEERHAYRTMAPREAAERCG